MMTALAPACAALLTLVENEQLPRSIRATCPVNEPAVKELHPRFVVTCDNGSEVNEPSSGFVLPTPCTAEMLLNPASTGAGPVTVRMGPTMRPFEDAATVIAEGATPGEPIVIASPEPLLPALPAEITTTLPPIFTAVSTVWSRKFNVASAVAPRLMLKTSKPSDTAS